MMRNIKIFDTTLRDGEQSPGCSMNLAEKIEVAKQLETLGVDLIEAGFAASSDEDFKSVKTIAELLKTSSVVSLARTIESDIDTAWNAIKNAKLPRIHIFLATSPIHMKYKLKMQPEDVLERAGLMTRYARNLCGDVEFSAEDSTRSDREFLARVIERVINEGAQTVNIPDTVGYTTPQEMASLVEYLRNTVPNIDKAVISLHCHDDLGMGVANSLAGIKAGAGQAECTINGIGERAGNAALEEIVMALKTRRDFFDADTRIVTTQIYNTSRLLSNIIGQNIPANKAVIGKNAFAHESGIHQHGVLAEKTTYEIMTPQSVGIPDNKMVLGKHSGRHALSSRFQELGYTLTSEELDAAFKKFKTIADRKKDISDSDLVAILQNREYVDNLYQLETFAVTSGNGGTRSSCVIRLKRGDEVFEDVSLGDGPVDAAYNAIDKIISYGEASLEQYSIHSTSDGKDALGEVVVKLRSGDTLVTGRGLSTDIIESSILAYVNAVNKLVSFGKAAG